MADLADLTLGEIAGLIESRATSPVEVTQACLTRADLTEPQLNAFSRLLPEEALAAARLAESEIMAGRHLGPLHGVPVAVKAMFDLAGHPTTGSCAAYADNCATRDSAAVARLKAAGAVIVGLTHTHALAYGVTTPQSRNPWGADHTPGGSSGGSAASVAAGSSFIALGTDTGGSIRIPAACCGITGLKPTYGRCSTHGTMSLSPTLDHVGPLTRTAADAALCLQVLAGHDPRDPGSVDVPVPDCRAALTGDLSGVRIGVATGGIHDHVDHQVAGAVAVAVGILSAAGAAVQAVEIPYAQEAQAVGDAICLPEASAFHAAYFRDRPDAFPDDVARLLRDGMAIPAVRYVKARTRRHAIRAAWIDLFASVDVVLAPTLPAPVLPRGQDSVTIRGIPEPVAAAWVRLCVSANVAGLPAGSVPCGVDADGLPLAFQIVARPWGEATVLRVCDAWQGLTTWHERHPPLPREPTASRVAAGTEAGSPGRGTRPGSPAASRPRS